MPGTRSLTYSRESCEPVELKPDEHVHMHYIHVDVEAEDSNELSIYLCAIRKLSARANIAGSALHPMASRWNTMHGAGDVLEDEELDSLLPSTRPKTAQASVENPLGGGDPLSSGGKGGSSNDGASKSDGKVEGDGGRERGLGSGSLHSKSPRPSGAKSKSYEEGKEGWRGWSKRWEVHRMTMLREYSEGGALSSGADQVLHL